MFHYKDDDRIITNEDKKLIKNTFVKYSSSKDKTGLNKVDYKVAWLFLFGYKPSKVISVALLFITNFYFFYLKIKRLSMKHKKCSIIVRKIIIKMS